MLYESWSLALVCVELNRQIGSNTPSYLIIMWMLFIDPFISVNQETKLLFLGIMWSIFQPSKHKSS